MIDLKIGVQSAGLSTNERFDNSQNYVYICIVQCSFIKKLLIEMGTVHPNNSLSTCWLTINRECNIRCSFCYAQNKAFDKRHTMSYEVAKGLIEIAIGNGVSSFFVLGGEPTVHPDFIDIVSYIVGRGKKVIVVTNGIKLQNPDFCKQIKAIPGSYLITIAFSLKGSSNIDYKKLCGVPAYDKVLCAAQNCRNCNLRINFSYVITSEKVSELAQIVKQFKEDGISETISFSYCHDIINGEQFENLDQKHPLEVDSIFAEQYDCIDEILESNLSLHQTLPLCMCNKRMFNKMVERKQITTSCQLLKRNSIVFNTDGGILLCNHLDFSIGEYLKDFTDADSFARFWNSSKVVEIYKRSTTMPSHICSDCKERQICGGGCCIQWFASNFDSYNHYYLSKNTQQ